MLGFDTLGRLALGQGSDQGATTAVLVTNVGTFALTRIAAIFNIKEAISVGTFSETGQAALLRTTLAAASWSYKFSGQNAALSLSGKLTAGSFSLTGVASLQRVTLANRAAAFAVAGNETTFTPIFLLAAGAFALPGYDISFTVIRESWIPVPEDSETWTEQIKQPEPWAIKARRRRR